ncbi:protein disulfide oxidoreductase [Psychrobacter arenosus]|uniref:protein disulfide oxidoreductase n=1 Tax=Psychrobacter arenosus TaxID=256326 RepID=UPI00191A2103|nr:protein disulfide oxidoreductase [Psychrobacter arenosus]
MTSPSVPPATPPPSDSHTPTTPKTSKTAKNKPTTALGKAKSWLWTLIKYLAIFLLVYTAINWWRQPVMPAEPNLQLTDYQGQTVDIAALSEDSPVLVYFWGTWCPVCKITSPTVSSLAQNSPYPVVTIAVQSGSNQELGQFMQSKGYQFTAINDESGEMFNAWEGKVTPSFVIMKEGEMTQGLTGVQPEWSLRLRLWLSSVF